ncbi:hypothetical protein K504DRAFT_154121 [Pleomassaria siparia CBS 279.74]|uniref:Uncharacterized protein n=1 Tax=Pleomassaria siparia CBS 279.74 TaxID=1314801 RepID=A0A6G1KMK5_9PLEO|nr:hypothetical protein K504DRAFT_154121 [Pleomassaria siparia CBS 279.74]
MDVRKSLIYTCDRQPNCAKDRRCNQHCSSCSDHFVQGDLSQIVPRIEDATSIVAVARIILFKEISPKLCQGSKMQPAL